MIICERCGKTADKAVAKTQGSLLLELLLWLFFILPGVIYTIWRRSGKPGCPHCGSEQVVPLESPKGRELERRFASPAQCGYALDDLGTPICSIHRQRLTPLAITAVGGSNQPGLGQLSAWACPVSQQPILSAQLY